MKGMNDFAKLVHREAIKKGHYDEDPSLIELLMGITSEVSEAYEAVRKGRIETEPDRFRWYDDWEKGTFSFDRMNYQDHFKDTVPDELVGAMLRIIDLLRHLEVDIEFHIEKAMQYNATRPYKNGKKI